MFNRSFFSWISLCVLTLLNCGGSGSSADSTSEPETETSNAVVGIVANLSAATGGIDVDAAGNIYVADIGSAPLRQGTTVYKVTPKGVVSVFAQGQGLLGCSGNAFDSKGNLFQSNLRANTISKITPDGIVSTFVSDGVFGPVGIAIDSGDTLYVANCSNASIQKVTPDGVTKVIATSSLFNCPNGIALADDGNLYVANFNDGRILKVTMQGNVSLFATLPGSNNGHPIFRDGTFYVAGRGANRLFTISMTGEVKAIAGTGVRGHLDGSALRSTLSLPNDVAFNPTGDTLYFNEVSPTSGTENIPSILRYVVLDK